MMSEGSSTQRDQPRRTRVSTGLKVAGLVVAIAVFWWLATSTPAASPRLAESDSSSSAAARHAAPTRGSSGRTRLSTLGTVAEHSEPDPVRTSDEAPSFGLDHHHSQAPSHVYPREQGPVTELAQRFASESRGPNSEANELRVRAPFAAVPTIPPALVPSFECRRSVCRTELRWSFDLGASYTAALMRAVGKPAAPYGVEEAGEPDADGFRPVVLYIGLGSAQGEAAED